MPLFRPSPLDAQNWEALTWLEITTALRWIEQRIPSLEPLSIPFRLVKSVSCVRAGIRPFTIVWSRIKPGSPDAIEIPYSIISHATARRQASWLIAGVLHAAQRTGKAGPLAWKRIARAGGIAGVLFPSWSHTLALHRLESQALLILAGAGKLAWARLKIHGMLQWGWRMRRKDLEEAHWMGKSQRYAIEEASKGSLHEDEPWELLLEQASLECTTLAEMIKGLEKAESNSLQRLSQAIRERYYHMRTAHSKFSTVKANRKLNNKEVIALLANVEEQQLSHIHPFIMQTEPCIHTPGGGK